MSSRPFIAPVKLLDAGDMSTATLHSTALVIPQCSLVSFLLTWTGSSPVGTAVVETSEDFALNAAGGVAVAGTWNTLPTTPTSVSVSGNTGSASFVCQGVASYAVRITYTKGSGTGSLTVIGSAKS